jgi:hypothetical protein
MRREGRAVNERSFLEPVQHRSHPVIEEFVMAAKSESDPDMFVDETRQKLCQLLATAMREGASRFHLRFPRRDDEIEGVWFYTHQSNEWNKRDDLAMPQRLVPALWDQMENVSSRNVADYGSCRRVDHADRTDFDLTFHRADYEQHLAGNLESYLNGRLFYGHHDSGKDSRRRMTFKTR